MSPKFKELFQKRKEAIFAIGHNLTFTLKIQTHLHKWKKNTIPIESDVEETWKTYLSIIQLLPDKYKVAGPKQALSNFQICNGFILMVSEFEGFLIDSMKEAFKIHPKKIGNESFELFQILDKDIDELIRIASERRLYSLMYKKPNEYKKNLCEYLSISPKTINERWPQYVECKARRDLGVHNDWIINETYLKKLKEINIQCEQTQGYYPPTGEYFWDSAKTLDGLMKEISTQCMNKFG